MKSGIGGWLAGPSPVARGARLLAVTVVACGALDGCGFTLDFVEEDVGLSAVPSRVGSGRREASVPGRLVSALSSSPDLCERIQASRGSALVGLRRPDRERGVWEAKRLITQEEFQVALQELLAIPGVAALHVDTVLPMVAVTIADRSACEVVRALPNLDYLEPGDLDLVPQDIGCGSGLTPNWTFARTPLGDIIPRMYPLNGIPGAWNRGADGQGVTVGMVDTGISRAQTELSPEAFSSAGRSVTYHGCATQGCLDLLASNQFDECDHGTRLASVIGAPANGASIVGVAFGSNLVAEKAGNSVWSDDNASAYAHLMAIRTVRQEGARVIEMAFGGFTYSNSLADEIRFEYFRTDLPEVLFVGAAGTGVCPIGGAQTVVFPAVLPEVLAVTGVNPDGTREPSACAGKEVRLAAVLQDSESVGLSAGSITTVGGTSAASAVVAASAALVWSRYPSLSRSALIERMISKSRMSQIGVPVLDAFRATGGTTTGTIVSSRASAEPCESYTLTVLADGDGPYSYLWNNGETSPEVTRTGPGSFSVVVTDLVDGNQLTLQTAIERPPNSEEGPFVCTSEFNWFIADTLLW